MVVILVVSEVIYITFQANYLTMVCVIEQKCNCECFVLYYTIFNLLSPV